MKGFYFSKIHIQFFRSIVTLQHQFIAMEIKKVCVYCASSPKVKQAYFDATEELAVDLVKNKIDVVFGGGAVGLMGKLADVVIREGGNIKGIMPHFMKDVEWAHKEVNEFQFVEDMHERKKRFLDGADALIALPGGTGTFEELFEAITLKKLGLFTKPIIILNIDGFYEPIKMMLEKCIDEQFMRPEHRNMWTFVDHAKDIVQAIKDAPEWSNAAIQFAAVK